MNVVRIAAYRCKESVSILKALLTLAVEGKLRGLMICFRTDDGDEEIVCTGVYKASPGKAASASMRMSIRLMQANGEID